MRPSLSSLESEDHLAPSLLSDVPDSPTLHVFDPDTVLSQALLSHLSSSTSVSSKELCKPFIRTGFLLSNINTHPISFVRGLLDTGAQGSNFVSRQLYQSLPSSHIKNTRNIDRIVRLADARHVPVQLEVSLTVSISDSNGQLHTHQLWCSVLDELSHDLIICLLDLIGPFYDVFADAVTSSRNSAISSIEATLNALTDQVQCTPLHNLHNQLSLAQTLTHDTHMYQQKKHAICSSNLTNIHTIALQDGSTTDILSHPTYGTAYADNRVESHYGVLTTLLTQPSTVDLINPW